MRSRFGFFLSPSAVQTTKVTTSELAQRGRQKKPDCLAAAKEEKWPADLSARSKLIRFITPTVGRACAQPSPAAAHSPSHLAATVMAVNVYKVYDN